MTPLASFVAFALSATFAIVRHALNLRKGSY